MTINEIFISGARVVRDATLREAGQISVANFTIAINHSFKKGDEWVEDVSFIDCVKWNASPTLVDSLKKGAPVTLAGRLKQEKWTDKNGMVKSVIKIIADKVIIHPRLAKDDAPEYGETSRLVLDAFDGSVPSEDEVPF